MPRNFALCGKSKAGLALTEQAMLPIRIGSDLVVRLGAERADLTPKQGLRLAEDLIRKSTRRMMLEEAAKPPRRGRAGGGSRSATAACAALIVAIALSCSVALAADKRPASVGPQINAAQAAAYRKLSELQQQEINLMQQLVEQHAPAEQQQAAALRWEREHLDEWHSSWDAARLPHFWEKQP